MTTTTIDPEMTEALIRIKKQIPQINAVQLEHIVLNYYEVEPAIEETSEDVVKIRKLIEAGMNSKSIPLKPAEELIAMAKKRRNSR